MEPVAKILVSRAWNQWSVFAAALVMIEALLIQRFFTKPLERLLKDDC